MIPRLDSLQNLTRIFSFKKNKSYEIALVNLETYYSFPNITTENNHFSYSPDRGEVWYHVLIPEGSYDIEDINEFIQQKMKQNRTAFKVFVFADIVTLFRAHFVSSFAV